MAVVAHIYSVRPMLALRCQRNVRVSDSTSTFLLSRETINRTRSRSVYNSAAMARIASRVPPGTWDTHMHVVDPKTFPLDKAALYNPPTHTLEEAKTVLGQMGIKKMVIVQPSIYGNDNACTLDGLQRLGSRLGRAVIQFDPAETSKEQLQEWHDLGVRGVRLNFRSLGVSPSAAELGETMHRYADAVRHLDWALEVYASNENLPSLELIVKELPGVKVCIDHFGHPTTEAFAAAKEARDIPGYASLINMLKGGNVWVKVSAAYRMHPDPSASLVESMFKELLRARPDRCVFATDWPHTRFGEVEVDRYLEKLLDWCEEEGVSLDTVLVKSAEELFDAKDT